MIQNDSNLAISTLKGDTVGISAEVRARAAAEVESLLRETQAEGVERLVAWLRDSRFYTAAASDNDHNNFGGGLLCHSLNVCREALRLWEGKVRVGSLTGEQVPRRSVVLASLLHDVCKEDVYLYRDGRWVRDPERYSLGHGRRSVEILRGLGLGLTADEETAIRWHDGAIDIDYKRGGDAARDAYNEAYARTPLLQIVHTADHSRRKPESAAARGGFLCPLHYIPAGQASTGMETAPVASPGLFKLDCTPGREGLSFAGVGDLHLERVVRRDCPGGSWRTGADSTVSEGAGGTLGTLACDLAYLGWSVRPVASPGESEAADRIVADLRRHGADTSLVNLVGSGKTYIRRHLHCFGPDGGHETEYGQVKVHTSVLDTAGNASRFANRWHLSSKGDAVQRVLAAVGPRPDVFFFDDFKPGSKRVAEELRKRGSVVVFKPSTHHVSRDKALEYTSVADIVWVSRESFASIEDYVADPSNRLLVQTLDSEGARFNLRGKGWAWVDPAYTRCVLDPTGAGEAALAVFLNNLAQFDSLTPERWDRDFVDLALSLSMRYAAYSLSFLGSKGLWEADPARRLSPPER